MPGEYASLSAMVKNERAWAKAQELSRVVKLLNELMGQKEDAAEALGLVTDDDIADDIETLMQHGFGDVSWADIMLVAAPAILQEARDIVRR